MALERSIRMPFAYSRVESNKRRLYIALYYYIVIRNLSDVANFSAVSCMDAVQCNFVMKHLRLSL